MRCNVIETETEEGKGEGGGEGEWEDWTKIAAVTEGGGLGGGGAHWWYLQLLLDRSGGGSDGGGLREGEVILSRADPTGTLLDIAGSGSVPCAQRRPFRALPRSLRRACRLGRDAVPAGPLPSRKFSDPERLHKRLQPACLIRAPALSLS